MTGRAPRPSRGIEPATPPRPRGRSRITSDSRIVLRRLLRNALTSETVLWTAEGLAAHDPLPVLMSYDDIQFHHNLGHLAIAPGSPAGGPAAYFQCPLLPVK